MASEGFGGDGGAATAAQLYQPTGVKADAAGNLFITDKINNRVRKVDGAGIISTVGGNGAGGFTGDGGPAVSASINFAAGLALDAAGNIYVADANNNRIRKINPTGNISTIAGSGVGSFGDGGPAINAQINAPQQIAIDACRKYHIC